MNVLLVEDEASLADVLARNFTARGHTVVTACTAGEALQNLREGPPDAMVLDVNLPDETGWEVLRRLDPALRDSLRVIVISAAPLSATRLAEFKPARWFQKPFPLDALMRSLSATPLEEPLEDE